jgi:hypothetical protein
VDNFLPSMLGSDLPVDTAHIICESDFRFFRKHANFTISELPLNRDNENVASDARASGSNRVVRKNRPAEIASMIQSESQGNPSIGPDEETTYIKDVMAYFNTARRSGIHLLFFNWYGGNGGGIFGRKTIPQHGFGFFVADRVGLEIIQSVLSEALPTSARRTRRYFDPVEHIDVLCFQSFQSKPNEQVGFLYPSLGLDA